MKKTLQKLWDYIVFNLSDETGQVNMSQILLMGLFGGLVGTATSSLFHGALEILIEINYEYLFGALEKAGVFSDSFPKYNYIWMGSILYILPVVLFLKFLPQFNPGGFAPSVEKLHNEGVVPTNFFFPLFFCTCLCLSSGAGVGPEAGVMVFAGGAGSFVTSKIFKLPKRASRTFVLCCICGGHSAFFGSPITGLFGLENMHAIGIEYYEAFTPGLIASFVGGILMQFIFKRPFGSFFHFDPEKVTDHLGPINGLEAIFLGCVGGLIAFTFFCLTKLYAKLKLRLGITPDHKINPFLPLVAWIVFSIGGMLLPPILFWGEPDFQNVLSLNASPLPHWKGGSSGIINLGTEYSYVTVLMIGLTKLLILPFNIAMNMKGGIVFPLFHIGGTIGQFVHMITKIDQSVAVCAVMAASQAAITRTPFASALVASFNATGSVSQILIPTMIASYTSTLLNYKFGIFPQQKPRNDIQFTASEIRSGSNNTYLQLEQVNNSQFLANTPTQVPQDESDEENQIKN